MLVNHSCLLELYIKELYKELVEEFRDTGTEFRHNQDWKGTSWLVALLLHLNFFHSAVKSEHPYNVLLHTSTRHTTTYLHTTYYYIYPYNLLLPMSTQCTTTYLHTTYYYIHHYNVQTTIYDFYITGV